MLKFLYFLSLLSLSLGQLMNLSKSSGINLYIFDFVVATFALYGTLHFLFHKTYKIPRYLLSALPFVIIAVTSLIYNSSNLSLSETVVAASYLIRLINYILAGVIVYNMLLANLLTREQFIWSLYLSAILLGIGGLIQLVILPDFTVLNSELGWDPHQNRLASTFFDPNFAGAYFNIVIAVLLNDLKSKRNSGIRYAIFFFLVTCVFLTFSRSAWGMLGIIIFLHGVFRNRKMLIVSFLIVFLAYFAIPRVQTRLSGVTDPADSARFRLESWGNAFNLVDDSWFLGVGYNAYKYAQRDAGFLNGDTFFDHSAAGSDSSFLFVLVTTGVFGAIAFLIWWFLPLIDNLKLGVNANVTLIYILVGLSAEAQFINSIFYPQILFLLVILLARSSLSRNSQ